MVATQDLKSCDQCDRAGSSPALGTKKEKEKKVWFFSQLLYLCPVCLTREILETKQRLSSLTSW